MSRSNNPLILIELNEVNFDIVEKYLAAGGLRLPALKKLLNGPRIRTTSESEYEQLEPWVQWVSVHTGKTYAEHGVFRLGDIVGSGAPQIFEQLERAGYKVGSISAMNAENRLERPAYFIPDPWTQTPSDSSWWSRSLGKAIAQAVNDNAQARITFQSALCLLVGLVRFARFKHYRTYLALVIASHRKPWLKALVLDLLLHDIHWGMFKQARPDFSALFLNAGAHIQHHYFFNAAPLRDDVGLKNPDWYISENEDPLADLLKFYDMLVQEYIDLPEVELMLATGLTQKPYDRVKFYYRLNSHEAFLHSLGIKFLSVTPRMTRDFLVQFETMQQALAAQEVLSSVFVEGVEDAPLFGEIDNRGKSLFVALTYPYEITSSTLYHLGGRAAPLSPQVSFVAIKNGMHHNEGFAFFTQGVAEVAPQDGAHVSELNESIMRHFGIQDDNVLENAIG